MQFSFPTNLESEEISGPALAIPVWKYLSSSPNKQLA
jgi:hypothetical protein